MKWQGIGSFFSVNKIVHLYPESEEREKSVTVFASVYIHNVQAEGTQHKSMMKPAYKGDGCTTWSTYSNYQLLMRSKGQFRDMLLVART